MRSILKTDYSIQTRLSPQEVRSLLEEHVGDRWDFSETVDFWGTVTGDTFRISIPSYSRNSFRPVLHGTILASGIGSIVQVNTRLHPFTLIFSIIWLGVACRFLVAGFSLAVHGGSLLLICISVIFLIGYLLLAGISFRHGYQSAKKRLYALLAEKNRP